MKKETRQGEREHLEIPVVSKEVGSAKSVIFSYEQN